MNTGAHVVALLKMLSPEKQEEYIKSASNEVIELISKELEEQSPEYLDEQEKLAAAFKVGEAMGKGFLSAVQEPAAEKPKE